MSLISSHCLVSLWGSYIDICGQKIVKGYLNQYIAVFAGTVKTELNKILVWLTNARHLSLHYTILDQINPVHVSIGAWVVQVVYPQSAFPKTCLHLSPCMVNALPFSFFSIWTPE